jgi:putative transposase
LGIRLERIAPGEPQQNGRHERFHQTLKQATAAPPRADLRRQQGAFTRFQREYNRERPHEALAQRVPAEFYRPSPRPFPDRLPHPAYPFACNLRRVSAAGHVNWIQHQIYLSVLLEGEDVALREVHSDMLEVHFGPLLLGWIDVPSATFAPIQAPPRRARG